MRRLFVSMMILITVCFSLLAQPAGETTAETVRVAALKGPTAMGLVQLMDMMDLLDAGAVSGLRCHLRAKEAGGRHEDVYPDAEIGGCEQALAFGQAAFSDFRHCLVPAGSADHDGQVVLETAFDIARCCGGRAEINRHIGLRQQRSLFLPVLFIVDEGDDGMIPFQSCLFYFLAHFPVTEQSYLELFHFLKVN